MKGVDIIRPVQRIRNIIPPQDIRQIGKTERQRKQYRKTHKDRRDQQNDIRDGNLCLFH